MPPTPSPGGHRWTQVPAPTPQPTSGSRPHPAPAAARQILALIGSGRSQSGPSAPPTQSQSCTEGPGLTSLSGPRGGGAGKGPGSPAPPGDRRWAGWEICEGGLSPATDSPTPG